MMEKETIKAWEFCCKRKSILDCMDCPYRKIENCLDTMLKDSFELYNKQRAEIAVLSFENANIKISCIELVAEIERLRNHIKNTFDVLLKQYEESVIETAKSEAIKEFWRRLKKSIVKSIEDAWHADGNGIYEADCVLNDGEELVKEMVGDE